MPVNEARETRRTPATLAPPRHLAQGTLASRVGGRRASGHTAA